MMAHGGHWFSKVAVVVPLASILVLFTVTASGVTHIVGDSIWSIPPVKDFYKNWSSSRAFLPGDVLYFEFESGMYNVVRVQGWEYEVCWEKPVPLESYSEGPAWVSLPKEGEYLYVSDMLNYCRSVAWG